MQRGVNGEREGGLNPPSRIREGMWEGDVPPPKKRDRESFWRAGGRGHQRPAPLNQEKGKAGAAARNSTTGTPQANSGWRRLACGGGRAARAGEQPSTTGKANTSRERKAAAGRGPGGFTGEQHAHTHSTPVGLRGGVMASTISSDSRAGGTRDVVRVI